MGAAESKTMKQKHKELRDQLVSPTPDTSQKSRETVEMFLRVVPAFRVWSNQCKDKTILDTLLSCIMYEHSLGTGEAKELVMAMHRMFTNAATYTAMLEENTFERLFVLIDPASGVHYPEQTVVKGLQAVARFLDSSDPEIKGLKLETRMRARFVKAGGVGVIARVLRSAVTETSTSEAIQAKQQVLLSAFEVLAVYFGEERFTLPFQIVRQVMDDVVPVAGVLFTAACGSDDTVAAQAFTVIGGMMSEITYEEMGQLHVLARQSGCLLAALARSVRTTDTQLRRQARFALVMLVDGCEVNLRIVRKVLPPALAAYLAVNAVGYSEQLQSEVAEFTEKMLPIPLKDEEKTITPFNPAIQRARRKDRWTSRYEQSLYERQVLGTHLQRSNWRMLWRHYESDCQHPLLIWNIDIRNQLEAAILAELRDFRTSLREAEALTERVSWNDFSLRLKNSALINEHVVASYYLTPLHDMLMERCAYIRNAHLELRMLGISPEMEEDVARGTTVTEQIHRQVEAAQALADETGADSASAVPAALGVVGPDGVYHPRMLDEDARAIQYAYNELDSLTGFNVDRPRELYRALSDLLVASVLKGAGASDIEVSSHASAENLVVTIISTMRHLLTVQPLDVTHSLAGMSAFLAALIHPAVCNPAWAVHLFSLLSMLLEQAHIAAPYSYKQAKGDAVAAFVANGGMDSLASYVTGFAGTQIMPGPVRYSNEGEILPIDLAEPVWQDLPVRVRNAYGAAAIMHGIVSGRRRLASAAAVPTALSPYHLIQGVLTDSPVIAGLCTSVLAEMAEGQTDFARVAYRTGAIEAILTVLCRRPAGDNTWTLFNRSAARALYYMQPDPAIRIENRAVAPADVTSATSLLRHYLPGPLINLLVVERGGVAWADLFGASVRRYNVIWNSELEETLLAYLQPHIDAYLGQLKTYSRLSWAAYRACVATQTAISEYPWTPETEVPMGDVYPVTDIAYPTLDTIVCVGDVYLSAFLEADDASVASMKRFDYFCTSLCATVAADRRAEFTPETVCLALAAVSKALRLRPEDVFRAFDDGTAQHWYNIAYGCVDDDPSIVEAAAVAVFDLVAFPDGTARKNIYRAYHAQALTFVTNGLARWMHPSVYPDAFPGSSRIVAALLRAARPLMLHADLNTYMPTIVALLGFCHTAASTVQAPNSSAVIATAFYTLHSFMAQFPSLRFMVDQLGSAVYALGGAFFPDFIYPNAQTSTDEDFDRTETDERATMGEFDIETVVRQGGFRARAPGAAATVSASVVRHAAIFLRECMQYDDSLAAWVASVLPQGMVAMLNVPAALAQMLRPDGAAANDLYGQDIYGPRCVYSGVNQGELWSVVEQGYTAVQAIECASDDWRNAALAGEWPLPDQAVYDASEAVHAITVEYTPSEAGNLLGGVHVASLLQAPQALVLDESLNEDFTFFSDLSARILNMIANDLTDDGEYYLDDLCTCLEVLCGMHPRICQMAHDSKVTENVMQFIDQISFSHATVRRLGACYRVAAALASTPFTAQVIARRSLLRANVFAASVPYVPADEATTAACTSIAKYFVTIVRYGVGASLMRSSDAFFLSAPDRARRTRLLAAADKEAAAALAEEISAAPLTGATIYGTSLPFCTEERRSMADEAKSIAYILTDYAILANLVRILLGGLVYGDAATDVCGTIGGVIRYFAATKPKVAEDLSAFFTALTDDTYAQRIVSSPAEVAAVAADLTGTVFTTQSVWNDATRNEVVVFLDKTLGARDLRQRILSDTPQQAWAIVGNSKRRHGECAFSCAAIPAKFSPAWRAAEARCCGIYVSPYVALDDAQAATLTFNGVQFFQECNSLLVARTNTVIKAAKDQSDAAAAAAATAACVTIGAAMRRVFTNDTAVQGSVPAQNIMVGVLELVQRVIEGAPDVLLRLPEPVTVAGLDIRTALPATSAPGDLLAVVLKQLVAVSRVAVLSNAFCNQLVSQERLLLLIRPVWQLDHTNGLLADALEMLADAVEGATAIAKPIYNTGTIMRALHVAIMPEAPFATRIAASHLVHITSMHFKPARLLVCALLTQGADSLLGSAEGAGALAYYIMNPVETNISPQEWSTGRRNMSVLAYLGAECNATDALVAKLPIDKPAPLSKRLWNTKSLSRTFSVRLPDDSKTVVVGVSQRPTSITRAPTWADDLYITEEDAAVGAEAIQKSGSVDMTMDDELPPSAAPAALPRPPAPPAGLPPPPPAPPAPSTPAPPATPAPAPPSAPALPGRAAFLSSISNMRED